VRFAFIAVERAEHSVTILCRCVRVTRGGFYAWLKRPPSHHTDEDTRLRVLVRVAFEESRQRDGSPRIHAELQDQDVHVSRKRVVRLMQQEGLKARARKRYKSTTMSDHDEPVAANLLQQDFTAAGPNERWVGWAVSAVNDRHLVIKALEMALKRRCPLTGLLHHSDQGSPYASEDYQTILETAGITCSMSRRGNGYDNAVMESFFSTVKSEQGEVFDAYGIAKAELFDDIEVFDNQRRRHSTLGQISPATFERRAAERQAA
jgi:transposase InsO family protein